MTLLAKNGSFAMPSIDLLTLTANQILAIKAPEKLYTGNPDEAKQEYRRLAKKWHPDRGGLDSVFAHLKGLYEQAEKKFENKTWKIPGMVKVETKSGRVFEIRYRKHHVFELGQMYITDTVIVYMLDKDNKDLLDNSRRVLKSFKFANDAMKKEFQKYLPEVMMEEETEEHYMVVYKKTPDLILLRDVIDHFGSLPTTHAAWILSSLYNLACYFKYTGVSHNAISPDTYFISPKFHSGAMLGGWWYSAQIGSKLIAVPQRTIDHSPSDLLKSKMASPKIDTSLIKTTGLEMLGDPYGSKILMDAKKEPKKFPAPFINWLKTPGGDNPMKDYETYKTKVLVDSWGPPKFYKLELTAEDVYK